MKNLKEIFYFIVLNLLLIFNLLPILAAIFVAGIVCLIFFTIHDNSFPAIITVFTGTIGLIYILFLPPKFIIYPVIYEYIDNSSIIFKFFEKLRTNKLIAIITFLLFCLLDYIIYLYLPKNLIAYSPDDWIHFYKKSQLLGLTFCFLSLLLWFKIRKHKNNGKILFCYYIALSIACFTFLFGLNCCNS